MKCQEKLPKVFPHIVKAGNAIVKVYRGKSRGYPLFTVVHYRDGKRNRQTFAKFSEARSHAQDSATHIAHGRVDVLSLTSADRDSYAKSLSLLEPLAVPLHAAVEEYVIARNQLGSESLLAAVKDYVTRRRTIPDKRVQEVVMTLLESKKRDDLSVRYLESLRSHLNRFAAAFQTNIANVTAPLISDWLANQEIGPRARNNIRMSIVTLFHFARAQGFLPKGRPTEADDVSKAKDRGGKIEIFTPKEMADIMKSAAAEHALFFALGAFAGLRRAEIERLDWSDFNFERGHITVGAHKAKTATRRLVPIHPNLMQWLSPWRYRTGKLFPSRRLADYAIAAVKEQGMKWPDNGLRHSYGTYRLAAIADSARVALEMGNSVQKLMTNYRELADERDATAWFALTPAEKPANVIPIKSLS